MLYGFNLGDLLKVGTCLLVASGAGNLTGVCWILVEHQSGSSAIESSAIELGGDCAGLGELGGTDSGRGFCGDSGNVAGSESWFWS